MIGAQDAGSWGCVFSQASARGFVKVKPPGICAGFDSRENDPLRRFTLRDEDFVALTKLLMNYAREHCQGRLVSVLEGGYNLAGLASAVSAHVGALMAT